MTQYVFMLCIYRFGTWGPRDTAPLPTGQSRSPVQSDKIHWSGDQENLPRLQSRVSHRSCSWGNIQDDIRPVLPSGWWVHIPICKLYFTSLYCDPLDILRSHRTHFISTILSSNTNIKTELTFPYLMLIDMYMEENISI